MEENRIMENLENEEILTDLEVYNDDQEVITEPDETEETDGIKHPYLLAYAVGVGIGAAALGIKALLKYRKDRKIKKENERFEDQVRTRLSANGFSVDEIENILKYVLDTNETPNEENKEDK